MHSALKDISEKYQGFTPEEMNTVAEIMEQLTGMPSIRPTILSPKVLSQRFPAPRSGVVLLAALKECVAILEGTAIL